MIFYLLRHGIAIDREHPDCPDEAERFLTDIGRDKTAAAARGMAKLGISPDAIITSPYVRAAQTAEIAKSELGHEREVETDRALIWTKPAKRIVRRIAGRSERSLMLVGHAPHLDELADYLLDATDITEMKKASLLHLEGAPKRGGALLVAYYPPRALRALGGALT